MRVVRVCVCVCENELSARPVVYGCAANKAGEGERLSPRFLLGIAASACLHYTPTKHHLPGRVGGEDGGEEVKEEIDPRD